MDHNQYLTKYLESWTRSGLLKSRESSTVEYKECHSIHWPRLAVDTGNHIPVMYTCPVFADDQVIQADVLHMEIVKTAFFNLSQVPTPSEWPRHHAMAVHNPLRS